MLIQPISDLHLDCLSEMHLEDFMEKTLNPEADILIIAGDAAEGEHIDILLNQLSGINKPIYYVAGNHEYWADVHCKEFIPWLKRRVSHLYNVKVLEDDHVVIDDVVLIGGTLWTNLHNPINANLVRHYMADFRHSPGLTTDFTNKKHDNTVEYIQQCLRLEQYKDKKKIVVTHHGPSFQAVDEFYKFDSANCGYQSNLDYILESEWAPEVWIHGHSHKFMDKFIGNTRVIRNPSGYKSFGEFNTGFDPKFLIDTNSIKATKQQEKSFTDIWGDFEDQFK